MAKRILLGVCLFMSCHGYCQTLVPVDTILIHYPVAASIDKLNRVYIADKQGDLKRYNKGKPDQVYSPQQPGDVTLIEASNPLKIFLFYADFQEYIFLDRFLTGSAKYSVPEQIHFSSLMTISNNNDLWIIDDAKFLLKKYEIGFHDYTVSTSFDLILDRTNSELTFMREYQNLVFISDKNSGILIFDNLGNYLRRIPALGVSHFSFHKDNLIYISGDTLFSVNIYSHEQTALKIPEKALFGFRYDAQIALITATALKIYNVR